MSRKFQYRGHMITVRPTLFGPVEDHMDVYEAELNGITVVRSSHAAIERAIDKHIESRIRLAGESDEI